MKVPFITEKPEDKNPEGSGQRNPANQHGGGSAPVLRSIIDVPQTVIDELNRQDREQAYRDEKQIFWNRLGVFAVIGYGAIALFTWLALLDSNSINNEALTSVQRAFVTATGHYNGLRLLDEHSNAILGFAISPTIENSGVTPALDTHGHISGKVFHGGLPKNYSFPDLSGNGSGHKIGTLTFGPKNHRELEAILLSVPDMKEAVENPTNLVIWGWITYRDIFEDTPLRRTEFCDIAIFISPDALNTSDRQSGGDIIMSSCAQHNCTDEHCADRESNQ